MMRSIHEIRNDIRRLKRAYHKITCGELRDIFRRYGDKQIYLIDAHGAEVPGAFYRIHDFLHSYRWELHPLRLDGIKARISSIGSIRGPGNDTSTVKYLSREAFGQWGGYVDVPVYICETVDGADPSLPAFGEYTICGDKVIFRRTDEAYAVYGRLSKEFNEANSSVKPFDESYFRSYPIQLPQVRRQFPKLFADSIIGIPPNVNQS
jgi:hypothetical protein